MIVQIRQSERAQDVKRKIQGMPQNEIGRIADLFNLLLFSVAKNMEVLHRSREKYNIVMNHTNNLFPEWDLRQETHLVSGRFEQAFGHPFPAQSLAENAVLENIVH